MSLQQRGSCVLVEDMQQLTHASNCQSMSLLVPFRAVHFCVYAVLVYQHQRQLNDD